MMDSSLLHIGNAAFLDDIYQAYLADPESVSNQWRDYFHAVDAAPASTGKSSDGASGGFQSSLAEEQVKVLQLISANRYRGHREADLDPLNLYARPPVPDLHYEHYGFTEADLGKTFNTGSLFMPAKPR